MSHYGLEIIPIEEDRVRRFVNGLIGSHRASLATEVQRSTYEQILDGAMRREGYYLEDKIERESKKLHSSTIPSSTPSGSRGVQGKGSYGPPQSASHLRSHNTPSPQLAHQGRQQQQRRRSWQFF